MGKYQKSDYNERGGLMDELEKIIKEHTDYTEKYCKALAQKIREKFKLIPKEESKENKKPHYNKLPWYVAYECARSRCRYKKHPSYKYYGKKGIRLLMKPIDFKKLWDRDKAELLEKPTIDRIDTHGNYTLENCQFIEKADNASKRTKEFWNKYRAENRWSKKHDRCIICNSRKSKHTSRGRCKACYMKLYREGGINVKEKRSYRKKS